MDEYILILVTVGSLTEGEKIGKALIEEGLAACVNILPGVTSIFRWKGDVFSEGEQLMLIKSRKALFHKIKDRVMNLHSYDVPEIIGIPITLGSPDYLKWIDEATKR